jgi:hypothetical protein
LDLLSFESLLPRFGTIVNDYGVEPSVAFYLWRPILADKIRNHDVDSSFQIKKKKLLQDKVEKEKRGDEQDEGATSPTSAADQDIQDILTNGGGLVERGIPVSKLEEYRHK